VRRLVVFAVCWVLHATVAFGQSGWTQQFPSQAPLGRNFHTMTYDAARKEVVLFGGIANNSQVLGDTWVWDGLNWIQKSPSNGPSPRYAHAMTYDAVRQEVVLFGGLSASGQGTADTWVWNGTTWTQKFPAVVPPSRDLAAMTFDSVRNETLLFGGRALDGSGFGSMLADTWVWDGVNWTQKDPATHPSARILHAVVFDASHAEVLLFGGRLASFPSDMDDTWVWDGVNWTQRVLATSPPPTSGHALAYSTIRAQVIMFGGYDNLGFSRHDTWAWDGTAWDQLIPPTSPPARTNHAMAYDSSLRKVVLFGGGSFPGADGGNFNDTWVFEDPAPRLARTKDDCKGGGWTVLVRADGTVFQNQGACVSYVTARKQRLGFQRGSAAASAAASAMRIGMLEEYLPTVSATVAESPARYEPTVSPTRISDLEHHLDRLARA